MLLSSINVLFAENAANAVNAVGYALLGVQWAVNASQVGKLTHNKHQEHRTSTSHTSSVNVASTRGKRLHINQHTYLVAKLNQRLKSRFSSSFPFDSQVRSFS